MDMYKAAAQNQAWGNKPCNHPGFDIETFNGQKTGDYVCTQCWKSIDPEEKKAIEAGRKGDSGG